MSEPTKEWLSQKIAAMESARDDIPFGLDEDDSKTLAALRIALASLGAEPVGEVVLGEYDDCGCHPDARVACIAADGQADWENFKDGTRLYTSPPAPVVPPEQNWEELCRHNPEMPIADAIIRAASWNACRAAMLQGAQPVSNRDELPDVELDTNESDRHWYLVSWCAKGGYAGFTDIYLSSPWANGSARKVAEIISELNMVTGLVITSVFPMPAAPQQEVK